MPAVSCDNRAWLRLFIDCCQTLIGGSAIVSPTPWLTALQRRLREGAPPLTAHEALVVRTALAKLALALGRTGLLPTADVLTLVEAIFRGDDIGTVFAATETQLRRVANCLTACGAGTRPRHRHVAAVLAFMAERHFDPGLTLRVVASHVRLSPWHVARLLRRETGQTFHFHLHRTRIHRAEWLLQDRDRSVKEISYLVGYRSTTQFDRHFRRVWRMTPQAYREWLDRGAHPRGARRQGE
jgi:AraC-like DNA-binding protein